MFHFKINHRILYTRDKLFRAKIIENDECQFCGVRQTLEYLFVERRHVHSFWNLLASWWNSCNLPKVALTNKAKIYAHHPEKLSFRAVNLCLIVARYYIYTAARESESYSITAFKVLLKSKLSTESPILKKKIRRFLAELRRPEGPPSGAPYPYREEKETHELIFSWLSRLAVLLVGAYARRRRRRGRARWRPYSS